MYFHIFSLYVVPRLLYGLESFVFIKKYITHLEAFISLLFGSYRVCLRGRQDPLPTYYKYGARPIEAELHLRCLTFLVNIIRSDNSTLLNIMERQLRMKEGNSGSWFIFARDILQKYGLPSPQVLQKCVPSNDKWKRTVQAAVNRYWNSVLLEDCIGKSTISRWNYNNLSIGKQHIVWKCLDCNTNEVRRGVVKVRLLTGTYLVQSKISRFNQYQVDPTCLLCRSSRED